VKLDLELDFLPLAISLTITPSSFLQERQHYQALAFRRPYNFSSADFLSIIKQVGCY